MEIKLSFRNPGPENEDYETIFFQNLIDRYIALGAIIRPIWADAMHKLSIPAHATVRSKKK